MKLLTKLKYLYILVSNACYFFIRYGKISSILRRNGCSDLRPFKFKRWHHGYAYFVALISGKKVFIKVDTKLMLLKNEKVFYDKVSNELSKFLLPIHFFHEEPCLQIVCFDFAEESQDLNHRLLLDNLNYLEEIVFILKSLKSQSVVHRDIKLDNFIVVNDELFIIDFTFTQSYKGDPIGFKELDYNLPSNLSILETLGDEYRAGYLVWNDFISLCKIIDEIISKNQLSDTEIIFFKNIKNILNELSVDASYTINH